MISRLLEALGQDPGNVGARMVLYAFLMGAASLLYAYFFLRRQGRENGSFFSRRESAKRNTSKLASAAKTDDPLAAARIQRKEPLRLGGIRIDGTPQEILGTGPNPTLEEVQKAYRDRMKQYHPDKIAPPGTSQWQDAQKIAEAINLAKEELLSRLKRSGK